MKDKLQQIKDEAERLISEELTLINTASDKAISDSSQDELSNKAWGLIKARELMRSAFATYALSLDNWVRCEDGLPENPKITN